MKHGDFPLFFDVFCMFSRGLTHSQTPFCPTNQTGIPCTRHVSSGRGSKSHAKSFGCSRRSFGRRGSIYRLAPKGEPQVFDCFEDNEHGFSHAILDTCLTCLSFIGYHRMINRKMMNPCILPYSQSVRALCWRVISRRSHQQCIS